MARFAVLNSFLSKSYQFLVAREMWSERSYVGFQTNDQVHVTVNSDTSNHSYHSRFQRETLSHSRLHCFLPYGDSKR